MTDFQKSELELTITRLETRIDSYVRIADRAHKQAFIDSEGRYLESAQFNKGQQFALEYVVYDLQVVLGGLKEVLDSMTSEAVFCDDEN